jgi:hypothetical protein
MMKFAVAFLFFTIEYLEFVLGRIGAQHQPSLTFSR